MSSAPGLRRADRIMPDAHVAKMLAQGFCGRLATVSEDGAPYCTQLLYIWMDSELYLHTTSAGD